MEILKRLRTILKTIITVTMLLPLSMIILVLSLFLEITEDY